MLFFGEQVRMVLCYILRLLHVCLCRGIAREPELLRQYTRSSQLFSCKSGTADNCKIDKDTKYMQHCQSLVHILDDGKLEIVRVQKYQKTRYCRNKNQANEILNVRRNTGKWKLSLRKKTNWLGPTAKICPTLQSRKSAKLLPKGRTSNQEQMMDSQIHLYKINWNLE